MQQIRQDVLKLIRRLNVWKHGDKRAPHKPLLLILAVARAVRGEERLAPFATYDVPLKRLLGRFGRPARSLHPEYPFWRLQRNALWEVPDAPALRLRGGNSDPLRSELLRHGVRGGLPAPVYGAMRSDAALRSRAIAELLSRHFPESAHADILSEVGLPGVSVVQLRDPAFRVAVLDAYGHKCAVCGYEARLGPSDIGVEAAHIKGHQHRGPCVVENGLALCAIHHKAFDLGAMSLTDDLLVLVSGGVHGPAVDQWFDAFRGRGIRGPHSPSLRPEKEFLCWHRKEVFRSPARE